MAGMPQIEIVTVTTPTCFECGKAGEVQVTRDGWERRLRGAKVQDAFPEMEPALREQMVNGTHPDCWDAMIGVTA